MVNVWDVIFPIPSALYHSIFENYQGSDVNAAINTQVTNAINSGNYGTAQQLINLKNSTSTPSLSQNISGIFSNISTTALIIGGVYLLYIFKK